METLELMGVISRNSTIDIEPSLYHSNISTLLQTVEEVEEGKTTMILSHNPGSEILVHQLSNRLGSDAELQQLHFLRDNTKVGCLLMYCDQNR